MRLSPTTSLSWNTSGLCSNIIYIYTYYIVFLLNHVKENCSGSPHGVVYFTFHLIKFWKFEALHSAEFTLSFFCNPFAGCFVNEHY